MRIFKNIRLYLIGRWRKVKSRRVTVMTVSSTSVNDNSASLGKRIVYTIHRESPNRIYCGQNEYGQGITVSPFDEVNYFNGLDVELQAWTHWKDF